MGKPIDLFNGKDLSGWTFIPASSRAPTINDAFQTANGILHYRGKSVGYLKTEQSFGPDYVLLVELRYLTKGDGGVLLAVTGADKVWPKSIEVQGQFGDLADLWNLGNFKMTADPSRLTAKRLKKIGPSTERPMGQWNTLAIISDHGRLSVELNGQLQNQASDVENLSGAIGLQAQDAVMEFRKVQLTPIENP